MKIAEAAKALGMSASWLKREVKARRVPFYRFGRSVRFSLEQVEQIKAQHLQRPAPRVPLVMAQLPVARRRPRQRGAAL